MKVDTAREFNGWIWLSVAAVLVVSDGLTKLWIVHTFQPYERLHVLPVLDITLWYNEGAFSFLSDASGWQRWLFTGLAVVVGGGMLYGMRRLKAHSQWMQCCALALVLGGGIGNVIDRLRIGHIVDFILAHWNNSYFPAFNLADVAIVVGALMLLLDASLEFRRSKTSAA